MSPQNLLHMYLNRFTAGDEVYLDKDFGIRQLRGSMKIGDSDVTFHEDSMILKDEKYYLTPGLIELIFKRSPNMILVSETDIDIYQKIILSTNTHRMYYKPGKALRTSNSMKYKTIIKNLFTHEKTGTSLPHYMIASKKPPKMDHIYWDDPNELVDRLQLLMASHSAGNMSHTNEIMSIMAELREAAIY